MPPEHEKRDQPVAILSKTSRLLVDIGETVAQRIRNFLLTLDTEPRDSRLRLPKLSKWTF